MVERIVPRVQNVVLPLLREALPDVQVTSWVPRIDQRDYPMLNIRRIGGLPVHVDFLDRATLEVTAHGNVDLAQTEEVLLDARQVLWDAVRFQTPTDAGFLHSYRETMGPTQFDSHFEDSWRVQMLVQLGLRPGGK